MTQSYEKAPACPPPVWNEIVRIAKRGNDAVVKIRNGEIQVVELERKVRVRAALNGEPK